MGVLSPLLFGLVILIVLMGTFLLVFFPEVLTPRPIVNVTEICISKCMEELALGRNLSKGPCLLDPIPLAPDWVCDVAHKPREEIDNLPENQCSSFLKGKATNFVEVNPECEFIGSSPQPTHIFIKAKKDILIYFDRLVNAMKKLVDTILTSLGK